MRLQFCLALTLLLSAAPTYADSKDSSMLVYIGTSPSSKNDARGIYLLRFNPQAGTLSDPELAVETPSSSFITKHPALPVIYACTAMTDPAGKKTGAVASFSIDPQSGKLTLLNQQPSGGAGPCHVSVDAAGTTLVVANYSSGSVASFKIEPNSGKLSAPVSTIQHTGKGPNPKRQEGPHAHSINFDPTQRFALAADLGTDQIFVYRFDPRTSALTPNDPPSASLKPGAGPRHLAFSRDGKSVFVVNELDNTVAAFAWNEANGSLERTQNLTTLPKDFTETSYCAEITVSPNGKHLYASNRGHDSLAVFSIDPSTGQLTALGQTPTTGNFPRHFAIDPTGQYLLASNQNSSNLVLFKVNPDTGALTQTNITKPVGGPTCVLFVK